MVPANVVVIGAGILTLVVIWLVVPVVLGCSVVVVGIGVVAPVEVACTALVVGANPETLMVQEINQLCITDVTNETVQYTSIPRLLGCSKLIKQIISFKFMHLS